MIMKKLVFFLVCLFTMQVVVADNDKPVTFEQLPQAAQSFVKKHFADRNVAFSKMDKDIFDVTYDVMFVNGDKLEFDKRTYLQTVVTQCFVNNKSEIWS